MLLDPSFVEGFKKAITPRSAGAVGEIFAEDILNRYFEGVVQELVADIHHEKEDPIDFSGWWLYEDSQRIEDLESHLAKFLPDTEMQERAFSFIIDKFDPELVRRISISSVEENGKEKDSFSYSELKEGLSNWKWRIYNLYKITNEQGKVRKFVPREGAQSYFIENLHSFNWVLKSRQHGITTLADILGLDHCCFSSNKYTAIVAHTIPDARLIFKTKVRFPFENLPAPLLETLEIGTSSTSELSLRNDSMVRVTVSTRSGTPTFTHISELGTAYGRFPDKAEEIDSGTSNAVHEDNFVVVEATAYGQNLFYDRTMLIKREYENTISEGRKLGLMQYKFFFFPWYMDPKNEADPVTLTVQEEAYFGGIERETGYAINDRKRAWYVNKSRVTPNTSLLWREQPSTADEAFKGSVEGAFFADERAKIETEGRIMSNLYVPSVPLRVAWDLGMGDLMVLLFYQVVDGRRNALHVYADHNKGLDFYIKYIENSIFGFSDTTTLIFPHDIKVRELTLRTGETRLSSLKKLKIKLRDGRSASLDDLPIYRVLRPKHKIEDIDTLRENIDKWYFEANEVGTEKGGIRMLLKSLGNYRKEYSKDREIFMDHPASSIYNHYMDAMFVAENSLHRKMISLEDLPPGLGA